jgi:hypothetical protein
MPGGSHEGFSMPKVFLVPGFFGFTELGSFNYFRMVSNVLKEALAARSMPAEIVEVNTLPTGSIRRRAIRLADFVREKGGLDDNDEIHFVGHSTGGLDIRMLLTPGVQLRASREETEIALRTRTIVTLSCPHFGTPLANFFTSLNGRNVLYLLTLLATSSAGRYGIYLGTRLLATFANLDRYLGQRNNILDALAENVFRNLTPDRGDMLWEFIREVSSDQGAMVQLTPEAMDIFNAAVGDREGVRYVSFASAAPPPNLREFWIRPRNLYQPLTHSLYALIYWITCREHRRYPYPTLGDEALGMLHADLPVPITGATNDGIVPVLSQVWGHCGGGILGDHLDVVGQFQDQNGGDVYATWLVSGSGFDEERFRTLWGRIADVIAGASERTKSKVRTVRRATPKGLEGDAEP